ncbi:tyrosine-type recombinase/integrase [Herbidospora sp. NEAU-GS84]|uniref:Tyrosine-type recombinase/integrase n=2 Tax=Herbidospora solisilvae TaxID=2696284 RepID=A0A7C9J1U7_9ACTN|nr:tyrosine-type recombinase/integrase [Herbidospora solisilvae]
MGVKADGSPDRRHRKAKTEAEVTRKVQELEKQRDSGQVAKAGRPPTVEQWITEFLDVICARLVQSGKLAPRTLSDYRSKSKNWIIPLLGKHRLDKLAPEHLDTAYSTMLERRLSPSSVLKVHRILSRALTIGVRRGRITRNVATLIDAPTANPTEIEPLTLEEARRILDIAKTRRNGARWSVALSLGIRQGEALGLRWSYVDLETGQIKAWFQIQRTEWRHGCSDPHACGQKWHRPPCKKNCKIHTHEPSCKEDCKKSGHTCYRRPCLKDCAAHADKCPAKSGGGLEFRQRKGKSKLTLQCPPALLALLKEHRRLQAIERLKAGDRWEDNDLVFATRLGGPIERTEDWKVWKSILRQAKVRDARVHDARHTAATLLIEQGVHIRVVQEVLGHTKVTTTERYTHVASLQMKDASDRLGSALWGG